MRFLLFRKLRILHSKDFSFVIQHSQRTSMSHLIILSRLNMLTHPRIGLIVAKKYVPRSHDRNQIKRIIRESFRLNQYVLPLMDFIIIATQGITSLDKKNIKIILEKLWQTYH